MKKYIKLSLLLFCLWCNKNAALAQENPQNLNDFKYQDTLRVQLQKHGLDMYALPALDPCARLSKPPLLRDNPFEPGDSMPSDSVVFDTTTLVIGGGLGKSPGDVNIFWIHGLNGTTETWRIAAQATQFGVYNGSQVIFPARKAASHRGTASSSSNAVQLYSEDGGIGPAVFDVEGYMKGALPVADRTVKDFIIAHSQGGIVGWDWLRKSDINFNNKFDKLPHGLVTFGSPLGGAKILNNAKPKIGGIDNPNNKVPAFMREACISLAGAFVKPKVNANFWTRLLISSDMQNTLINNTCDVAANSIVPFILDNYFKGTTEDFYVESPYLIGKNTSGGYEPGLFDYTLKVPVVQFYGVEKEPVLWKFMSSAMSMGHDKLDNQTKIFGYAQDNQLEEKVNNMINEFDAGYNYEKEMENYYATIANVSIATSFLLLPIISYVWAEDKKLAANENKWAYHWAKLWLTNANDYYLTDLVGARVSNTTLNCRVVGNIDCRDNRYNGIGSGVPPVNVSIDYNFNTTNSFCNVQPVSVAFADYRFRGHNGTEWHGPCTGNLTVIPTYKTTYWYKDNDGVVLAESAKKEINVDKTIPGVTQTFVKLPETNHDQMKNSTITKEELNNLYNGVHGEFFKIPVN